MRNVFVLLLHLTICQSAAISTDNMIHSNKYKVKVRVRLTLGISDGETGLRRREDVVDRVLSEEFCSRNSCKHVCTQMTMQ